MTNWLIILGAFGASLTAVFWLETRQKGVASQQIAILGLCSGLITITLFFFIQNQPTATTQSTFFGNPVANNAPRPKTSLPQPRITTYEIETETASASSRGQAVSTFTPHSNPTTVPHFPEVASARLRIAQLNLNLPIAPIPIHNQQWDVSQLGSGVGWLTTTGTHPGDKLAMAFAGHMTFPTTSTLEEGAFANLQTITLGTEIIYQTDAATLFYEVTAVKRIPPDAVDQLYVADGNTLLLITCTDWDENGRVYANRLLIEAESLPYNR